MTTNKPHTKIYLQCCDDDGRYIGHEPGAEVTWCADKINQHDAEYVLASEFYALRERLAALERELEISALSERMAMRQRDGTNAELAAAYKQVAALTNAQIMLDQVAALTNAQIMLDWLIGNGHLPFDVYAMAERYVGESTAVEEGVGDG